MPKIKYICKFCNKEFESYDKSRLCCSKQCSQNFYKEKSKKICKECHNVFYSNIEGQLYCSNECKFNANRITYNCDYCGKEVVTTQYKYDQHDNHFCSNQCFDKFRTKSNYCKNCGQLIPPPQSMHRTFCCNQCRKEYNDKLYQTEERKRICIVCNNVFYTSPSNNDKCCSRKCRDIWLKENVYNTDEYKNKMRNYHRKALLTNNRLNTGIQIKINNLLDSMNIEYQNEKECGYYAIDNYLTEYNLMIEVMGEYWHSDIRRYKDKILNHIQLDAIRRDKAKHTYIKNHYGIDILYIWEKEIDEDIDLCKNLILEYIQNNGILNNYHSFNYNCEHNTLLLNENILLPFQNLDKHLINA